MQVTEDGRDFFKELLTPNADKRPNIAKVLSRPWLQNAKRLGGADARAAPCCQTVGVAPQPAPTGVDAAARIAGTDVIKVHEACAAIRTNRRTATVEARAMTPPLRDDTARQVRSRIRSYASCTSAHNALLAV